jgi:hypothetical protein
MRDITIFTSLYRGPREVEGLREDETHSSAKILFAYTEKDGRAKIATNENIR